MPALKLTITAAALAGTSGLACAAPVFIFEQSQGTFNVTFEDANSRNVMFATNVSSEVGGLGIVTVDGDYMQTFSGGNPDAISGSVVMTGASNLDTLTIDFDGLLFDNGFDSFSGTWNLTGSTGAYAQYTSGSGNESGSYFFTGNDSGSIFVTFQGTLVPAPGALGLLGLASGVVCARRRRA